VALEDDIHSLIRTARESKEKLAERAKTEEDASIIVMTGWLQGIEDALVLLAREVEDLKAGRMPNDEED
jgi:hypothetical protein